MSLSSFHGLGELWRETLGDERICIAVIDGPADLSHPCFQGADLTQFDDRALIGGSTAAHGTMVASIIFGRPGSSVEGAAPGCRGLLISVFSEKRRKISQLALSTAICKAVEHGAHVINISSGQLTYFGESEDLLAHAIEAAHEEGMDEGVSPRPLGRAQEQHTRPPGWRHGGLLFRLLLAVHASHSARHLPRGVHGSLAISEREA